MEVGDEKYRVIYRWEISAVQTEGLGSGLLRAVYYSSSATGREQSLS
jgi:hypothetical protein